MASRRFAKAQLPRHGAFTRMGLAPQEIHILLMLGRAKRHGEGCPPDTMNRTGESAAECGKAIPSALAGLMGVTAGNVTQIITGLESKGLVKRDVDPEDRRRVLISLTDDGLRAVDASFRAFEESFSRIMEEFGEAECDRFTTLLEKAADRLGENRKEESRNEERNH